MTTPTWADGLAGVRDNGFGGSRGGATVDGIVLHHTTSVAPASALNYVAEKNSRNSHPSYLVKTDGSAWGIVNPVRRPYSTGGAPDSQCVSFEVDDASGAPSWEISAASLETIARIALHHYRQSPRYGHGVARNIPSKVQSEFFVAWHSQYVATACPGPSMIAHLDWIIARILELDAPVTTPPITTPPVTTPPVTTPPVTTPPVTTPPPIPAPTKAQIKAAIEALNQDAAKAPTAFPPTALAGLFAGHPTGRRRVYYSFAATALLISFGPDIAVAGWITGHDLIVFSGIVTFATSALLKIGSAFGLMAASNTKE